MKAYKDPTADQAISEADKWERKQRDLEEQHRIHRGDAITIRVAQKRGSRRGAGGQECTSNRQSIVSSCGGVRTSRRNNQITNILGTRQDACGRWQQWKSG